MPNSAKPLKICLFAPEAYSYFVGEYAFFFQEREFRAWLFTRGLSSVPDLDVTVLLKGPRKGPEVFDGVEIHSLELSPPLAGASRYANYKWSVRQFVASSFPKAEQDRWQREVMAACDQIAADVYCTFGINNNTHLISDYCRDRERKHVIFLGSETHLLDRISEYSLSLLPNGVVSFFAFQLLSDASAVFVPAGFAEQPAGDGAFAVHPCPAPLVAEAQDNDSSPSNVRHVLWMGETSDKSRPMEFLELAKAFPEVRFKMLAYSTHVELNQALYERVPRNLELIAAAGMKEIENLFRTAAVFVNTAPADGFVSGCYLAAKHGVPILSLESDPEGFIGEGGGGVLLNGEGERLLSALRDMLGSLDRWKAMSKALEDRLAIHNDPAAVGKSLMSLLGDCAG
jgi:hypothetical protein